MRAASLRKRSDGGDGQTGGRPNALQLLLQQGAAAATPASSPQGAGRDAAASGLPPRDGGGSTPDAAAATGALPWELPRHSFAQHTSRLLMSRGDAAVDPLASCAALEEGGAGSGSDGEGDLRSHQQASVPNKRAWQQQQQQLPATHRQEPATPPKRQRTASAGPAEAAPRHWACGLCTYASNPRISLRCEMCGTHKLGPSMHEQQAVAAALAAPAAGAPAAAVTCEAAAAPGRTVGGSRANQVPGAPAAPPEPHPAPSHQQQGGDDLQQLLDWEAAIGSGQHAAAAAAAAALKDCAAGDADGRGPAGGGEGWQQGPAGAPSAAACVHCQVCGCDVEGCDWQEHQDWHVALELQRQDAQQAAAEAAAARAAAGAAAAAAAAGARARAAAGPRAGKRAAKPLPGGQVPLERFFRRG